MLKIIDPFLLSILFQSWVDLPWEFVSSALSWNHKVLVAYLNAYDEVVCSLLQNKWNNVALGFLLELIDSSLSDRKQIVKYGHALSDPIWVTSVILQNPNSVSLFYIAYVIRSVIKFSNFNCLMYKNVLLKLSQMMI